MKKTPDKADRLLAAARKRDAIDEAIHVMQIAKNQSAVARGRLRDIIGQPSYATNRMLCVEVEIDAALRGLRCARRRASLSIAGIARSKS